MSQSANQCINQQKPKLQKIHHRNQGWQVSCFILISYIPADIVFRSDVSWCSCWTLAPRRWINQLRQPGLQGVKKGNNFQFQAVDGIQLMLSAASSPSHRVQYSMCGCVLAFPSPTPFLRVGCRGMAIGKKRGRRREPIEGLAVLPSITKGAGISRMIYLRCSPAQSESELQAANSRKGKRSWWGAPRGSICIGRGGGLGVEKATSGGGRA